MKIKKIQNDILECFYHHKVFLLKLDKDKVLFGLEKGCVFLISRNKIELNIDKCKKCSLTFEDFLTNKDRILTKTDEIKIYCNVKLRKFIGEFTGEIWIQEDYLKYFSEGCTLYGYSPIKRLIVMEKGEIVGFIIACKLEGGN